MPLDNDIKILPVAGRGFHHDKKAMRDFIELPQRIYADSPHYVPWFKRGMKRILQKRHPFFDHSEGEFFIVRRGDSCVGRIALLEPKRFNTYQKKQDARFYFPNFFDDASAADALFSFAEEWARRRGLRRLIGPQGFSGFTGAGILIKGFDEAASMTMMNYHFPYYRSHFERLGFTPHKDFFSAQLHADTFSLPDQMRRLSQIARKRSRLQVRKLKNRRDMKRTARKIMEIYNSAWVTHDDFCPLTENELRAMISDLMLVTEPSLIKIFSSGDELAGFLLTFPDLTKALQRSEGRLTPLHLLDILLEKRRTRRYLVNGIGILPKYQKLPGQAMLFEEIVKTLRSRGVDSAEMTQIAETTDAMIKGIEKLNGDISKIHRVYMKMIT